jgi:hypothetical protein
MDAPAKRMLDLDIHIACADLWMLIDLVESQYWPSRNFSLLKQVQPFFCGPRLQDLCEGIHQGRKVRHAITVSRKEWILQQVWTTQGLNKAFPVALIRCSNSNPAVGCCEYLIRVSGHSDLCSSRIELEAILTLRRNVPPLLS